MKHIVRALMVVIAVFFSGCYSFTGASISPDIKTIEIPTIMDESGGPAFLSIRMSEKTRNYFLQNTNLKLVKSNGDLVLNAVIVAYNLAPSAQVANNVAAQTRLTMTLKVSFENTKDESQNFKDQLFSNYRDFEQTGNLAQEESRLIDEISEFIVTDIFNKTVANW